ncbi:MAG: hypothetical protein IPK26_12500 [Planctomycetes bacterium]|nr:hypothetical protein [Planctomycetota bacterium]
MNTAIPSCGRREASGPGRVASCWLAALLASGLSCQDTTPGLLFDTKQTSLAAGAAGELASGIVEYAHARAQQQPGFQVSAAYRKLIRVAYELSSETPAVAAAHTRIQQGMSPSPPKQAFSAVKVLEATLGQADAAQRGDGADDGRLARCLFEVASTIDPGNVRCLAGVAALHRVPHADVRWADALAAYRRVVPNGFQSSILGLAVSSPDGTAQVGAVSRILMTWAALREGDVSVEFLRPGGSDMQISSEEAVRYWDQFRVDTELPPGRLRISFEEKFTTKDGPSAGAAFAVLLRSFSDPFVIDPRFAMTGDVSVEGRVLPVGGVFAKVRGAALGGCTRVGIPLACAGELVDALVLAGPQPVLALEVIGLANVEDAIALARLDRSERVLLASERFGQLRKAAEAQMVPKPRARSAEIDRLVADVLAMVPNHISARLIGAWNAGSLPARLSIGGSLEAVRMNLIRYLTTIRVGESPDIKDVKTEVSSAQAQAAQEALRVAGTKLAVESNLWSRSWMPPTAA